VRMGQYRMQIDLQKCVGCSACALACKTGNNTQARASGQTFNWADFINETVGAFPNTKWISLPTMCNHCENPACVRACPVAPDAKGRKAVYKTADGIVMFNNKRCVGCRACQKACPYSVLSTNRNSPEAQYSVISYNAKGSHEYWSNDVAVIPGCTTSPKEMAENPVVASVPPNKTEWEYDDDGAEVRDIRAARTVEKCNFCVHRIANGEQPYCVAQCPAMAREVVEAEGADTPFPATAKVQKPGSRAKVDLVDPATVAGSLKPQVYYINDFSAR
jgi:Fe-S-cluster-containing dehydrogenase component